MVKVNRGRILFFLLFTLLTAYIFTAYPEEELQAHLKKAGLCAGQLNFSAAVKHLVSALEIDPRYTEAHIQLGHAYAKMGKIGEAIQSYSYAIELQPDASTAHQSLNALTHYNLGVIFARRGLLEKAEAEYRQAIQLHPSLSIVRYQLGYVYARQGKFAEAIPFYKQALERYPQNTGAYYQLANAYFRLGSQTEGERQLKKLREIKAKQRFDVGDYALKNGDIQEAVKSYQRALDMNAEFAPAYARLGTIAYQQDELEDAQSYLQRALALKPDFALVHYQLGWVYEKRGETGKAIESFEASVALKPGFTPACNTLAMFYLERGDHFNEAVLLAKRAVKAKPISAYWDTLAYAFYKKQRYKAASEAIAKALELQPNAPEYVARQKLILKAMTDQDR
jgi:tetratricopeptide (TPR) repeat protein